MTVRVEVVDNAAHGHALVAHCDDGARRLAGYVTGRRVWTTAGCPEDMRRVAADFADKYDLEVDHD